MLSVALVVYGLGNAISVASGAWFAQPRSSSPAVQPS